MSDLHESLEHDHSRRDFHRLALTAVGGLMAGLAQPANMLYADGKQGNKVKKEIHVCRGLNSCKGQGTDADLDGDGKPDVNACAGQGACATAKHISCNGENDCRGQGGCGNTAGINSCKGQGKCQVPLKENVWKKARARFEARMKQQNKAFGNPPAMAAKAHRTSR
jgi:hypothetical protein